jgi:hypothetical protein
MSECNATCTSAELEARRRLWTAFEFESMEIELSLYAGGPQAASFFGGCKTNQSCGTACGTCCSACNTSVAGCK